MKTMHDVKLTCKTRIDAFFLNEAHRRLHDSAYKRWIQISQQITSTQTRVIFDIIKDLPLSTVRLNNKTSYREKVEFIIPFVPGMESSHGPIDTTPVTPKRATIVNPYKKKPPPTPIPQTPHKDLTQTSLDEFIQDESQDVTNDNARDTSHTTTEATNDENGVQQSDSENVPDELGLTLTDPKLQKLISDTMEKNFSNLFQLNMKNFTEDLDNRIEHIVQEQLDQLFDLKISPFITKRVSELHRTVDNSTMETLIDTKIDSHLDSAFSAQIEDKITTKAEQISKTFDKRINGSVRTSMEKSYQESIQPRIRSAIDRTHNDMMDKSRDLISDLRHQSTDSINKMNAILQQTTASQSKFETFVDNRSLELKATCEKTTINISKECSSNLEFIAQEANDSINNFTDLATTFTDTMKENFQQETDKATELLRTTCKTHITSMHDWMDTTAKPASIPMSPSKKPNTFDFGTPKKTHNYEVGDTVWYAKIDSDRKQPVTILNIHYDDDSVPYYTVEYPTGKRVQTDEKYLSLTQGITSSPLPRSPYLSHSHFARNSGPKKNYHNHFDRDSLNDDSSLEIVDPYQSQMQRNAKDRKDRDVFINGPDSPQINQFHKFFKVKIETTNAILPFYQQLQSQGKKYGIFLLPIQDVRPNIDLCPVYIQPAARHSMMMVIYQKLQDEDCISVDYTVGRNYLRQYCSTCDGYKVLYQLLRLVHPFLVNGPKMYNLPYLSKSDDIYHYAELMRNYILVQEIQRRSYTEKEKSDMFLQNVDDSTYKHGRAKCLAELEHFSSTDGTQISKSDLLFENLPTTLAQYNSQLQNDTSPTIRALKYNKNNNAKGNFSINRNQRSSMAYKPLQCIGCGQWNHPVSQCRFVPKVSLALDYIKRKPQHVDKLVQEFKRVNNKVTKTGTVRVLAHSGMLDDTSPEDYLTHTDVEIPMEDIPDHNLDQHDQ